VAGRVFWDVTGPLRHGPVTVLRAGHQGWPTAEWLRLSLVP
jgi:hypothetical protein